MGFGFINKQEATANIAAIPPVIINTNSNHTIIPYRTEKKKFHKILRKISPTTIP